MSVDAATLGTVPAPHGPGRRRSAAELEAIAREASVRFADATADEVLAWASETFEGDALEAAGALQRGYFVAQARRYRFDPPEDNPATADGMAPGACYSYGAGVVERAFRSGVTVRDFTHAPDKLLRFEPPSS